MPKNVSGFGVCVERHRANPRGVVVASPRPRVMRRLMLRLIKYVHLGVNVFLTRFSLAEILVLAGGAIPH